MSSARRAVVVGAGVFGAVGALTLRRRGWDVVIADPGPLPHEDASSTDVSKVIRMDYGADLFYVKLGEASFEGWDRWNRDWPRPLYHQTGFLVLTRSTMAPGGFEYESFRALSARGHELIPLAELDPARLSCWTREAAADGYFNPRAGWAESGAVVARLLELCSAEGVEFVEASVAELDARGSTVSGVVTRDGERIAGDRVVLAAGAWTPALAPWLSDVIRPTAQPVLHFQVPDAADYSGERFTAWASDTSTSGWYGFPSLADGRVKIGHHGPGTRRTPEERGVVGDDHVALTRDFLRRSIPGLADAPVAYRRVCMYCDTFDGDFLIGADPHREGLVIATGGSGHGFKFAPVLGEVIADAAEGISNPCDARFGWRAGGAARWEAARFDGSNDPNSQ